MKRFLIFFPFFTAISYAQKVKTQKEILEIPNTTLLDFKSSPQETKTNFRKRAKSLADGLKKFKKKNGC